MIDIHKLIIKVFLIRILFNRCLHFFLELLFGDSVTGDVFETCGMRLIVLDRKLSISRLIINNFLNIFLHFVLFALSEPSFRLLVLLLTLLRIDLDLFGVLVLFRVF